MTDDDDTTNETADEDSKPMIQVRVPGPWAKQDDLIEALARSKTGYSLSERGFVHDATDTRIHLGVTEHDDELGDVFSGGHDGRMSKKELDRVAGHAVKVHLE